MVLISIDPYPIEKGWYSPAMGQNVPKCDDPPCDFFLTFTMDITHTFLHETGKNGGHCMAWCQFWEDLGRAKFQYSSHVWLLAWISPTTGPGRRRKKGDQRVPRLALVWNYPMPSYGFTIRVPLGYDSKSWYPGLKKNWYMDLVISYLVGGWPTPLKNMSSSVGMIIPKYSQYVGK